MDYILGLKYVWGRERVFMFGKRTYRNSASFGKRQEYVAIAELLRRGFDVYQTLVDDQGIDCIIRQDAQGEPCYIDIQIKARSKDCNPGNAGRFAAMEITSPRPNYFFIFYSEQVDTPLPGARHSR